MIWIFVVIGALAVIAIAVVTVSRTVDELGAYASPTVLDVAVAVDVIAERLPDEVAARLTLDDVRTIVLWQLDHFADAGLVSEYGEELAGEGAVWMGTESIADSDAAVDALVARALDESDLDAVDVVVVLDLFMTHLHEIGAIGPPAGGDD